MPPQPSLLRIALVGLVSLALAMGIGRFAFTPLLPMMREDGLVTITGGGFLASVHFLGYWLGAVVVSRVSCPPKLLLQLSLLAIVVGTLGMGVTDSFTVWLLLRWLTGLCSAWTLVLVGNYYVRRLAEEGRADYQGWVFSGVGAGICFAGLACLLFMVQGLGSAAAWQILGGISLLAFLAVSLKIGPEMPSRRAVVPTQGAGRSPLQWRIVTAYGVMGIGYIIPATYLPVMAREIVPSPLIFGWGWPVFGAAAFVSTILAAGLQKRFSNRQIWAVGHAVMAAGLLLPALLPHILTIIAAGLCVGGTFMIITMAGLQEAHRVAVPEDVMRHIAVMTAAFATGQMAGPLFASALYDMTSSFAPSLLVTSAALLVTAVTLLGGSGKPAASVADR